MEEGCITFHTGELPMFKIVRFPSALESFFEPLKPFFHWEHHDYFRTLVLLIAFAWGRRNVTNLCRYLDARNRSHRTRFNNFLLMRRFDPEALLRTQAYALLAALHPQSGEVIELVIDGSPKSKRGKRMEAVGWLHDSMTGKSMRGHQYISAVIRFRGYTIPWGIRLYVKAEACRALGLSFQKLTGLAAGLIRELQPPEGIAVRVLFDSYFLCPTVVQACREKGFHFVSTLKGNRNLFRGGRTLKAGKWGRRCFQQSRKRHLAISKEQGPAHYVYADAGWLEIGKLETLHVVFSRKGKAPKVLGIVTDDPALSAGEIVQAYDGRWPIEVFFKDTKQLLGLGQYQNGTYRAAVIHLHLVCFAYALLTHLAIKRRGEKGKRTKIRAAPMSMGTLQNELRRIVWDDLVRHLKTMRNGGAVIHELQRLLVA